MKNAIRLMSDKDAVKIASDAAVKLQKKTGRHAIIILVGDPPPAPKNEMALGWSDTGDDAFRSKMCLHAANFFRS